MSGTPVLQKQQPHQADLVVVLICGAAHSQLFMACRVPDEGKCLARMSPSMSYSALPY